MTNHRIRKPLLLTAILSVLLTQCVTTVKFIKASDSMQDPSVGFCGVYRSFDTTHPDFPGSAGAVPPSRSGLIYGSVPWRPNPASSSWDSYSVWQPDWYSTPSCLVRIDPAVPVASAGVTGIGLQFTPSKFDSISELSRAGPSEELFTVEWEARIVILPTPTATTLTFTMNSNDDSWCFFDGVLIPSLDLGGGRAVSSGAGTWMSPVLAVGSVHTITIYYAERCWYTPGPAEFYFGITPIGAFNYTDPSEICAKKSFEDLLRHQAAGIKSFEDLLENETQVYGYTNSTPELLASLENLTREQEGLLNSFGDMITKETPKPIMNGSIVVGYDTSKLLPAEFISLLDSFEDLLHRQYDIKEGFIDMLNETKLQLGNFSKFLFSAEELLRSDAQLLERFENIEKNLFSLGNVTADQQSHFLESYEYLLENQSKLLEKFENLIEWRFDLNGDGKVNIADVVTTAVAYGSKPGESRWNPRADLNGDNNVNIIDIVQAVRAMGIVDNYPLFSTF